MSSEKGSKFKRIVFSIFCGLLFGAFASVSFYGVRMLGYSLGIIENEVTYEANSEKSSNDDKKNQDLSLKDDLESEFEMEYGANASSKELEDLLKSELDKEVKLYSGSGKVATYDVTDVVEEKMPTIVSIVNNYSAQSRFSTYNGESSGSGIIIGSNDDEILIVTNYHVVEGADTLEITFCDDKTANAQVKGTDAKMDLAVIAVRIDDLSQDTMNAIDYAEIGDSDSVKVGEGVIAIGNSLGYGQSVTVGVVSAVNREIDINGTTGTFIQTDAAINPGNSGGALMNMAGEVIGINSNKIGGSTVEGMGYAIPISAAKPIIEELMQRETKVAVEASKQSFLGIMGATVESDVAYAYGYPQAGVYVSTVIEDSAAEKYGIKEGDYIVSLDGEVITSMEQLKKELTYYEGGETVTIELLRRENGTDKEMSIDVKLGFKSDANNG